MKKPRQAAGYFKFLAYLVIILWGLCSTAVYCPATEDTDTTSHDAASLPSAIETKVASSESPTQPFSFGEFPKTKRSIHAKPKISAIEVRGNYFVEDKPILDSIFSRIGEPLVDAKIKADLKAIYALGFFSDVTADFENWRDGTRVIFKVIENPVIRSIIIHGNTAISTEEIISAMQNQPGKLVNFKYLRSDIQSINDLYKDRGYVLARVENIDTDAKNHTLHVHIIEGKIESLVLEGNTNTKDYVILRELDTKPNSVLNENVLAADLKRVFNLGYFSEINPVFEPGSTKDSIIIVIKIKETRTSTINFGGGYGEADGWFGFIDLSVNNLWGEARNLLIRGQSGTEIQTYQIKYADPWFIPDKLGDRTGFAARRWYTVGTDVYLSDEDKIRNGWDLSVSKYLSKNFSVTYTFGSEKVDPYDTATFEAYLEDSIGVTVSYDTRDIWLNPTCGALYSLSLKEGWQYSSSYGGFFKTSLDLNQYIPVVAGQTFAVHVGGGAGFGDVPEGELFWAGGANTVRGYSTSDTKTGRKKFLVNLEHRVTFNDIFQGVIFFDWGNAWESGFIVPSEFITGWGPGVRLNTPLGPIRLDYGIAGGKNFGEGMIHFSIGQAF